jgi:thioredoxin reductase (NADPH)
MILARDVMGFETRGPVHAVCFGDGTSVEGRSLVIATGVSYRMLDAPGLADFSGRGLYYGATEADARTCAGEDVYIIGAANSAGQAVLNFARHANRVVMLVRSDTLEMTMSRYLIERIEAAENVEVRFRTEVVAGRGDGHLQSITLADRAAGTEAKVDTERLFAFIGAAPRTDWLGDAVVRDDKGFIVTGPDLLAGEEKPRWPLTRAPFGLETSVPGVFAAGDVQDHVYRQAVTSAGSGCMAALDAEKYLDGLVPA